MEIRIELHSSPPAGHAVRLLIPSSWIEVALQTTAVPLWVAGGRLSFSWGTACVTEEDPCREWITAFDDEDRARTKMSELKGEIAKVKEALRASTKKERLSISTRIEEE